MNGSGKRVFEMLWSVEPEVVRDAVRIGIDLAAARMAGAGERVPALAVAARPSPDDGAVARATSVTNRMLAYVAAAS